MMAISAKDIHIGAIARLPTHELMQSSITDQDRFCMMDETLRQEVASKIVDCRAKEITNEFYMEKRIDLYVATPDQFWEIVQHEALNMLRYSSLPR